jgi:hypothetical protein
MLSGEATRASCICEVKNSGGTAELQNSAKLMLWSLVKINVGAVIGNTEQKIKASGVGLRTRL